MIPNLIITNKCNLNCSFCFANETRIDQRKEQKSIMTLEQFKIFVDKFCREEKYVSLCGGEPTLHPDFIKMVEFVIKERNYYLSLLTNGIWPEEIFSYFKNFYSDLTNLPLFSKISILFNIPEYIYETDKAKIIRLKEILNFLPERSKSLSLTFDKPDFDGRYIIEIARESGVSVCRQSFAAPYINDNKSIDFVYNFREYALSLVRFIKEGRKSGIKKINADCGYIPYCAFKKEEISDIISSGNSIISLCSHEGPVDISNEFNWRCYGLFGLESKRNSINDDKNSLENYWMRTSQLLYNFSIFKNCESCYYWYDNRCRGGCHATKAKYIINKYSRDILYPFENDNFLFECVPVRSPWCSIYKNPTGNFLVMTASVNKKVKLVDVKFNYTFELLEILDGITTLKTIAEYIFSRYKSHGLTFSDIIQHVKYLHSLKVLELIPAYLDNLVSKIELNQTHQVPFFNVKGKIPCYLTNSTNSKVNGLFLTVSEEISSIFIEKENIFFPDKSFLFYGNEKIDIKVLSKKEKFFKLKKGIVLDIAFYCNDKIKIDNLLEYTNSVLNSN